MRWNDLCFLHLGPIVQGQTLLGQTANQVAVLVEFKMEVQAAFSVQLGKIDN